MVAILVRETSSLAVRKSATGVGDERRRRGHRVEAANDANGLRHLRRVHVDREPVVALEGGLSGWIGIRSKRSRVQISPCLGK